ncbi:MAG: hypothetical protein WA880_02670 [Ornithinimicrobium sp.]
MLGLNKEPDDVGGLWGTGAGFVGIGGWVIAFAVVLLLAWLAWWTMRPARRATRSQRTADRREADPRKAAEEPVQVLPGKEDTVGNSAETTTGQRDLNRPGEPGDPPM